MWPKLDSNQRPRTYQVRALPTKLLDRTYEHKQALYRKKSENFTLNTTHKL
jgi:hypothetical protein